MIPQQPPLARRAAAAVGLTLVLALGAAGCTSGDDAVPPPERPDPDLTGAAPVESPSASPSTRRTEPPPWVTRPRLTRSPATGAVDPEPVQREPRAFPRPADLGPAWTYRTPVGVEEDAGRGAPVLRRDPQDVVRQAVPPGCARPGPRAASPTVPALAGRPERASELGYEVAGDWVDVVRVQFATPEAASSFADARRSALRDCRGRGAGSAVGPLVTQVVDVDPQTVLSDRTPESDAYSDLAVVDDDTVLLLTRRTDEAPTLRDARALAAAFTGSRVPGGIN